LLKDLQFFKGFKNPQKWVRDLIIYSSTMLNSRSIPDFIISLMTFTSSSKKKKYFDILPKSEKLILDISNLLLTISQNLDFLNVPQNTYEFFKQFLNAFIFFIDEINYQKTKSFKLAEQLKMIELNCILIINNISKSNIFNNQKH
jgi:hypothetical protein